MNVPFSKEKIYKYFFLLNRIPTYVSDILSFLFFVHYTRISHEYHTDRTLMGLTSKTKIHGLSELYRLSDHRLSAKLVPTFEDRGCHVVSVTDPYGRILAFLDRSSYFFFQVALQLYSWGWVDLVPDPLFLRKSGSVCNRTWTSVSVGRNSDH
jgi:hypothetical protein